MSDQPLPEDVLDQGYLGVPSMKELIEAGSDIRSTICFEIIDGYFYGLSNQTTFKVTGTDLMSYYVCFRFPLNPRGFYEIKQAARKRMWRRRHAEGVIDDRWTSLRIFKDERTGMLKVIESRKE
ncbi:hypothetical protein QBC46DRAFT_338915 [Diplogelasinospora grovesii]|uniref:Uncharacterized protein n=1 Tax=Diplogelasinospora grovesii TaxID=303347 RepID=A0AAN6NBW6_9PEZI|nr:hypothetical protein QBC46DRAFT_338915 [Diplogelasinospora grovesii]